MKGQNKLVRELFNQVASHVMTGFGAWQKRKIKIKVINPAWERVCKLPHQVDAHYGSWTNWYKVEGRRVESTNLPSFRTHVLGFFQRFFPTRVESSWNWLAAFEPYLVPITTGESWFHCTTTRLLFQSLGASIEIHYHFLESHRDERMSWIVAIFVVSWKSYSKRRTVWPLDYLISLASFPLCDLILQLLPSFLLFVVFVLIQPAYNVLSTCYCALLAQQWDQQ